MFYVVYSPRGFRNELAIRTFESRKAAQEFRCDVDNDVNKWACEASDDLHKRTIRAAKEDARRMGMTLDQYLQF